MRQHTATHKVQHHGVQVDIRRHTSTHSDTGADPGGGVLGVRTPPPFGGPPNFIKREKMSRVCAQKRHILVLNSYPDPPPPFRNPVSAPGDTHRHAPTQCNTKYHKRGLSLKEGLRHEYDCLAFLHFILLGVEVGGGGNLSGLI